MKARKVKGIKPEKSLAHGARKIVQVRLDELYELAPAALDPKGGETYHDMRIAAKRLRYLLEMTEPCFGSDAKLGAAEAKSLQSLLGEIHDCDEMLPRVDSHLARLRDEDAAAVRAIVERGAPDLRPEAVKNAPHRRSYRGLETLRTYLRARRDVLFEHFTQEWRRLEEEGFRDRVEASLS